MDNQTSYRKYAMYLVLFAIILRLNGFFSSLTYDEIWSLENFANLSVYDIFTQLKLPNNHPLNTLFIKLVSRLNVDFIFIRLSALLSGIGVVLLLGVVANTIFKSKITTLVVLIASLFNYPLICFSQIARGYQLQCFLLLLYSVSLLLAYKSSNIDKKDKQVSKKNRTWIIGGLVLGSLGAIATLSTSAIYLTLISLAIWGYNNFKLPKNEYFISVLVSAFIGVIYLGTNYSNLVAAAEQWGTTLRNLEQIKLFVENSINPLVSYCSMLFLLGVVFTKTKEELKHFILLIILILVPFVSAFITNAGPARTYLPCVLSFILLLGFCSDLILSKFNEKKIVVLLVLICACLTSLGDMFLQKKYWQFVDTIKLFNETKKIPKDVMVVFSASLTFPLAWNNNPTSFEDFAERLANGEDLKELIMFANNNKLNGLDNNDSEATITVEGNLSKVQLFSTEKGSFYKLIPVESNSLINKNETILVVLSTQDKFLYKYTMKKLKEIGTVLILNPWLNRLQENSRILLGVKIKESFNEKTLTSVNSNVIIYFVKPKLNVEN